MPTLKDKSCSDEVAITSYLMLGAGSYSLGLVSIITAFINSPSVGL